MPFEHGAVDFIAKSRDKRAMARRLRILVDLTQPKARKGLAVSDRLMGAKLLLKPESRRAFWNHVDVGLALGEFNVVHLMASQAGIFVTSRAGLQPAPPGLHHFTGFGHCWRKGGSLAFRDAPPAAGSP